MSSIIGACMDILADLNTWQDVPGPNPEFDQKGKAPEIKKLSVVEVEVLRNRMNYRRMSLSLAIATANWRQSKRSMETMVEDRKLLLSTLLQMENDKAAQLPPPIAHNTTDKSLVRTDTYFTMKRYMNSNKSTYASTMAPFVKNAFPHSVIVEEPGGPTLAFYLRAGTTAFVWDIVCQLVHDPTSVQLVLYGKEVALHTALKGQDLTIEDDGSLILWAFFDREAQRVHELDSVVFPRPTAGPVVRGIDGNDTFGGGVPNPRSSPVFKRAMVVGTLIEIPIHHICLPHSNLELPDVYTLATSKERKSLSQLRAPLIEKLTLQRIQEEPSVDTFTARSISIRRASLKRTLMYRFSIGRIKESEGRA
ncbi:hypothetical protein IFR05_010083 [Cadophora sp. M221]|nr:hypothetical protein IFR05_010083 [Cadophora sp. M221]